MISPERPWFPLQHPAGMSGIGDSGSNMQALAPGAKLEEEKRFPARTSAKELADWASRWM